MCDECKHNSAGGKNKWENNKSRWPAASSKPELKIYSEKVEFWGNLRVALCSSISKWTIPKLQRETSTAETRKEESGVTFLRQGSDRQTKGATCPQGSVSNECFYSFSALSHSLSHSAGCHWVSAKTEHRPELQTPGNGHLSGRMIGVEHQCILTAQQIVIFSTMHHFRLTPNVIYLNSISQGTKNLLQSHISLAFLKQKSRVINVTVFEGWL